MTVDLVAAAHGSLIVGIATGLGIALTPIVWAIGTHADPHALHFALVAIILWLLVRWEHARRGDPLGARRCTGATAGQVRTRGGPRRPPRRSPPPRRGGRRRPVGREPLADAAARPADRPVRPRGRAGDPPPAAGSSLANIAAFAIPTVLVRFEMILRAGWFRAPFVYADPSTWAGFWYVTLGAQFHGWLTDPFANAGQRVGDLRRWRSASSGRSPPVLVVAFVVTVVRQPRYALLTGTTMVLTCFFNSVYPDGAIDRYYIGPALIAWTWLAILAATIVDAIVGHAGPRDDAVEDETDDEPIAAVDQVADRSGEPGPPPRRASLRPIGLLVGRVLLAPSLVALPERAGSGLIDRTADRGRPGVDGRGPRRARAERRRRVVVELLDAALVRHDRRRPAARYPDHRRSQSPRPEPRRARPSDRPATSRPARSTWSGTGPSELGALVGRYDVTRRSPRPTASDLPPASTPIVRGRPVTEPAAGPLVLLPGPQRGGQPRGARRPRPSRPCRRWPTRSRSSSSTTARATRPGRIADELTAANPGVVRAVHHPTNLGYGAALRSGFRAARHDHVAFTDGDRQFRVEDVGRLIDRMAARGPARCRRRVPDQAGRSPRPDPLRPGLPARQPDLLRAPGPRRRLRLQALPARGARRAWRSSRAARSSRPSC